MPKKLITVSCEHPRKQARSGSEDGEAEFKSDDEGADGIGGYDDDGKFGRRRRRSKSKKRKNKERGKKEAGGAVLRATPVSRTDSRGKETPRTVGRNIGLIRELCGLSDSWQTDVSSDKRRRSKTEAGALLSDDKVKKKSVITAASIKQERSGNYPDKGGEQRPKKNRSVAHDPGTRVYACWIDGSEHSGEWYPGTVVGHRIAKTGPDKGKRVYHIEFDDGDQSRSLEECFVMKSDQYLALIRARKGGDESSSSSTKTTSKTVPPRLHVCTPKGSATTNDGLPKTWECHVCKAHNTTPKRCSSCKAWRGGVRQVGAKVTKGRKALRKETTNKTVDEVLPSKRRKKDNAKEPSATKGRKDEEAKHAKLPRKIVTPSKRISVTKAVSAPSHKPGDAIYACTLEKNESSGFWYPGTVKNVVTIDQGPDVGFLQYDVEFDDGRAGARLKEDCIMERPHSHSNQVESEDRDSTTHSSAYPPSSRVIACWRTEWGDSSGTWFPGTIDGSRVGHHGPRKGKRFYHIKFDDGRVDKSLEEAFIMKRIDQSDDLQVGSKVLACWHTEDGWCTGRWYPSTIEGFASIHHGRGNTNLLCNVVYEDGSMNEGLDCKYVMMLVQHTNERGVPMTKFCVRGKGDVQVMECDNEMTLSAEDGRGDNENKVRRRDAGITKVRAKSKKLATMSWDLKEGEAFPDETSMSTRACIKDTSEKTVRPDEDMPAKKQEDSVKYGGAMQNAEGEAFPIEKGMSTRACIKDISKKTARPNDDMPAKMQEDSHQYRGAMQNMEGGGGGGVLSNQSKGGVFTGVTSPSADETMTNLDAEKDVAALFITERNLSSQQQRSNHKDRSGGEGVLSGDGDNLKTMPKKRDNFQEEGECVIVKNVQVSPPIKVEKTEQNVVPVDHRETRIQLNPDKRKAKEGKLQLAIKHGEGGRGDDKNKEDGAKRSTVTLDEWNGMLHRLRLHKERTGSAWIDPTDGTKDDLRRWLWDNHSFLRKSTTALSEEKKRKLKELGVDIDAPPLPPTRSQKKKRGAAAASGSGDGKSLLEKEGRSNDVISKESVTNSLFFRIIWPQLKKDGWALTQANRKMRNDFYYAPPRNSCHSSRRFNIAHEPQRIFSCWQSIEKKSLIEEFEWCLEQFLYSTENGKKEHENFHFFTNAWLMNQALTVTSSGSNYHSPNGGIGLQNESSFDELDKLLLSWRGAQNDRHEEATSWSYRAGSIRDVGNEAQRSNKKEQENNVCPNAKKPVEISGDDSKEDGDAFLSENNSCPMIHNEGTAGKEVLPNDVNTTKTHEEEVVPEKKERAVASVGSNQIDDAAETQKVVAKEDIEEVIELALDEMDFNTPSTFQEKQTGDENILSGSDSKTGVGIQEEGKQDLCEKNATASLSIMVGKIGDKCARSALGRDNEKDGMSPRAYQTFPLRPSSDSPPVPDGINKFPSYPQFPWNAASSRGQPYPLFRTAPFGTYQYQHPSCVAFDNIYSVTFSEPGLLGFTFEETEDGGTIITKVEPHSQADRAGIKAGDVVCSPAGDGRGRYPCSSFSSACIERPIDFNIRRQSAASTDTGALQCPYYPAPFNPYNSAPYQYLYPPHYVPQWTHAPYLEPTLSPPVQEAPNADKTSGKKKKRTRLKTPQEARKLRKNAQARARAAKLTDKFEEVKRKCSEERTVEEEQLLAKVEERRSRKNLRSKQRGVEKKQEIERILAIPEKERTKHEKIVLDTAMKAKQWKNEGDRIRRQRLKMLGIKGNTKAKGVTISGRPEKEPINFPNCGVQGLCDEPVTPPQPSPAGPTNHSGKHRPLSPPSPANNLLFPCESAEMPEVISKAVTMSPVQATVRCTEDARNGCGQDGPMSDIYDDGSKNEVGQPDNCTDQVPEYSSIEAV